MLRLKGRRWGSCRGGGVEDGHRSRLGEEFRGGPCEVRGWEVPRKEYAVRPVGAGGS